MYAIVFFPKIHSDELNRFRQKYDPKWDLIPPHITLVFPFPDSVQKEDLFIHVEDILKNLQSFDVIIDNYKKADDDYLYLTFKRGDIETMNLHDKLYTGILEPYLRTDLEYEPHLTIGYFRNNENKFDIDKYNSALRDLKHAPFYFETRLDSLDIIQINDNLSTRKLIRHFNI